MKIFKTILKSMAVLLVGAAVLTSCKNGIDSSEEAYLSFKEAEISRNITAKYEIADFDSYKISGTYEDYVLVDEKPTYNLGNWSTYAAMLNAYILLPNTGNWTFTLEASKNDGTKFSGSVTTPIINGNNAIAFNLYPKEYGTEGEGNVKIGVLIENLPFYETIGYDYDTDEYTYTYDVNGYRVTTTCETEESLNSTLTLKLNPECDADENELSDEERFGTTEGTYSQTGDFTAILNAEDVPAGEYDVVFHLSKGNLKDIKKQTVVITVTDGKTTESAAAIGYDYASADSAKGIAVVLNACEYNIAYELNGGSFVEGFTPIYSYSSLNEKDIILPTAEKITRMGATFAGWYTTDSFEEDTDISVLEGKGENGGDKTLYAKWDLITYTITYNVNAGTMPESYVSEYTVEDSVTLPIPTANAIGTEFKGWYTTETLENETRIKNFAENKYAQNFNLYAKYGLISYKINYNLNDGTNSEDAPEEFYTTDEDFDLPANPTKTGYNFAGWYTTSDFQTGTEITRVTTSSAADITVYAKWSLATYNITYHDYYANGNSYVTTYTYVDSSAESTPLLAVPETHPYYDFYMWNETSNFNSLCWVSCIPYQSTGDLDFYPKWTPTEYTITYNANGGTLSASAAASYNIESDTITLLAPAAPDGCAFDNWFTTADFQAGTEITEISTGSHGDIELYANYTVTGYTITYHANEGTMPDTYAKAFSGSIDVSLPSPTRTDYNFAGWYTTSTFDNGTEISIIDAGTAANVEVWAKWISPAYWTLTSTDTYTFTESEHVWTSNNQNQNSTSAKATWTITLAEAAEVSIPWTVSSESGYDKLTITLDSTTKVNAVSGSQTGTISDTLSAGNHTLTATYSKDISQSSNNDCGTLTLNPVYY